MMTSRSDSTQRGKIIGDKIRKVFLNADLRLVYAKGEMEMALADYKLHAKLGKKSALKDKAKYECYKIYIKRVNSIKSSVSLGLDEVLSRYTYRHKQIWVMYFLEQRSYEEIASEMNYSVDNVGKIIIKLKQDLSDYYKGETGNVTFRSM